MAMRGMLTTLGMMRAAPMLTGRAREQARHAREQAMIRMGDWVAHSPMAEELGIQPRRRWAVPLALLAGMAAGMLAGMALARRGKEQVSPPSWGVPEHLTPPLGEGQIDLERPRGLEEAVRRRLAEDARTADLPELVIDVAQGRAFVRGTVPPGADETVVREVVQTVEGIDQVDVQLTVRA